jgi:carbonic anhydrase
LQFEFACCCDGLQRLDAPALTGSADVLRAEGVQWILLRNPVYIYGDDAKALAALMGDNYRPIQPLNGRVITTSV